jgi:hypothetical protein
VSRLLTGPIISGIITADWSALHGSTGCRWWPRGACGLPRCGSVSVKRHAGDNGSRRVAFFLPHEGGESGGASSEETV